jgi:NAD(P)-dependent dehydrogenase (short-subunit alcohol dehydrogenase family)
MSEPVYLVLGAGPGLGLAVSRRFAQGGHAVTLATRSVEDSEPLAERLRGEGFTAHPAAVDLTDPADISRCVVEVGERHGHIDTLHFNPSVWRAVGPLELSVDQLLDDVRLGAASLLPAVQAALPFFRRGARVLVTGSAAADQPSTQAPSLGVQKAAVRNLVTALDTALGEHGVRAVVVQINGVLGDEGPFSPAPIADAMWTAVSRPDGEWTPHVAYDG